MIAMKNVGKVIGNKTKFAIEYKITRTYDNFMYGSFHYWINNEIIGDSNDLTTLNDIMVLLPDLVRNNGNRNHETLFKKCKFETIELFYEKLYSILNGDAFENMMEKFQPARFHLDLDIEEFQDYKVVLIESKYQSRIIYEKNNVISELYVEKGYVDKVIYQTYLELNAIYDSFIHDEGIYHV